MRTNSARTVGTGGEEKSKEELLGEVEQLLSNAIHGTLSESYRVCGNHTCRCHGAGPKHGPYVYLSYRNGEGKMVRCYVPNSGHEAARAGIRAHELLAEQLRKLCELNRVEMLARAKMLDQSAPPPSEPPFSGERMARGEETG